MGWNSVSRLRGLTITAPPSGYLICSKRSVEANRDPAVAPFRSRACLLTRRVWPIQTNYEIQVSYRQESAPKRRPLQWRSQ
jgi:hypothetical protein